MWQWSISHKIGVRYMRNNWGLPNLPKLHSLRLVPKFYLANSCQRQDVQIKKWYICIMHESAPVVWFPTCLILATNSCQVGEPDSSLWTFHLWNRFDSHSNRPFHSQLQILLSHVCQLVTAGVTFQLFSIIWPWKPYIFWMHIIKADHPDHLVHLDHINNLTTGPP